MQYFLEYIWVPNWLTRWRKTTGNNTSLFGNRYLENLSHETLSNNFEALRQPLAALRQPAGALRILWDPLRHSCSPLHG